MSVSEITSSCKTVTLTVEQLDAVERGLESRVEGCKNQLIDPDPVMQPYWQQQLAIAEQALEIVRGA